MSDLLQPVKGCATDFERIRQACESIFTKANTALQTAYFYRRELVAYRTAIDNTLNKDPATFAVRDEIVRKAKKHIAALEVLDEDQVVKIRNSVRQEIDHIVEAELRKANARVRHGKRGKAKEAK